MNQGLLTVRVAKKELAAVDIFRYELIDASGGTLPRFTAGAHIDVHIRDGLIRQYSLCNSSSETDRYEIGVLRDPNSRGGSIAMHEEIKEGDLIQISEPRNHFPLAHDAKESVLLAGGIGVTPILCMAERLANIGSPFTMHYCSRSQDRAAFTQRMLASSFSKQVQFHFDDGAESQKLDINSALGKPAADKHLYVCGPTGFLEFVRSSAKNAGWADSNVHYEYFGADIQESETTGSFQVQVASSGQIFTVEPDETIVNALEKNGVDIPISCEQGVCGTCLTRVIEGTPEHLDHYLTDDEREANDQILPCCSRSRSKMLILDL